MKWAATPGRFYSINGGAATAPWLGLRSRTGPCTFRHSGCNLGKLGRIEFESAQTPRAEIHDGHTRVSIGIEKLGDVGGQQVVNQAPLLSVKDFYPSLVIAIDEPERAYAQPVKPRVFPFQLFGVTIGKRKQRGLATPSRVWRQRPDVIPD